MTRQTRTRHVPIDPDDKKQIEILRQQRQLCGWGEENIPAWQALIRKGDRVRLWVLVGFHRRRLRLLPSACITSQLMWWIHLNLESDESKTSDSNVPIGHIALDWVDYAGDTSLANKEEGIM